MGDGNDVVVVSLRLDDTGDIIPPLDESTNNNVNDINSHVEESEEEPSNGDLYNGWRRIDQQQRQ